MWHRGDIVFPIMQHSDCNSHLADTLSPFNNTSMISSLLPSWVFLYKSILFICLSHTSIWCKFKLIFFSPFSPREKIPGTVKFRVTTLDLESITPRNLSNTNLWKLMKRTNCNQRTSQAYFHSQNTKLSSRRTIWPELVPQPIVL